MAGKSSKKKKKGAAPEAVGARVAEMKEGIRQMESFMKEAAAMAASEMRRIDEITGNLGETVARLEAGIRERDELLREKDSALQELEGKLTGRIREIESQLKEREELFQGRAGELKESRSGDQEARLADLEMQLGEKERMLGQKEASLKELEESWAVQIRHLEDQIREKEKLLAGRELEMADLRSKLEGLEASCKESVPLTEEDVVLLEEVEPGVGDGLHPVELIEAAGQDFETGREPERKAKVIEQSMRGVAVKLSKMVGREGQPDPKKSTLVSLLSPMKKRS